MPSLEQILQRKLHDSRVECVADLAERGRVEVRIDDQSVTVHSRPKTVQHIESLGAEFHRLAFPEMEYAGYRCVELPVHWQFYRSATQISKRSCRRSTKRRRVLPLG